MLILWRKLGNIPERFFKNIAIIQIPYMDVLYFVNLDQTLDTGKCEALDVPLSLNKTGFPMRQQFTSQKYKRGLWYLILPRVCHKLLKSL